MKWYLTVLKKYADFNSRATRSEYWYFALFNFLISMVLNIIQLKTGYIFLSVIYYLAVLIPSIAVAIRRMHDVNKSGWFILIPIYNLILACTDGTPGPNKYGSDPKRPEYDEFLEQTGSAS
jgi:uncharacterized membrane protein YhaH (DUF805 family)